jgi:hypothetical protein
MASVGLVSIIMSPQSINQPQQLNTPQKQQRVAEAPIDCDALQSAIRRKEADLQYVESQIAGDRTLQADAALASALTIQKYAVTLALGEFTRKCQSR